MSTPPVNNPLFEEEDPQAQAQAGDAEKAAAEEAPATDAAAAEPEAADAPAAEEPAAEAAAETNNKRPREDEDPEDPPEKKHASGSLEADPLAEGAPARETGSYADAVASVYGTEAAADPPADPPAANLGNNPGNNPGSNGPGAVAFSTGEGPGIVMDVPANMIGKLIGRAGETIRQLQLSSDTRIQVDHNTDGNTKRVTITGATQQQVEKARHDIEALMSGASELGGLGGGAPGGAPGGPPGAGGEATETMECPSAIVGRIIGRGGETIRALQSASEAHITVDQNYPEGVPRKIVIQGRPDACKRAATMITGLINGEPGSAQAIIQRVCQEYNIGTTHLVTCPKGMIGRIIGRQGETIKQIQRTTGATIQIDQSFDPCRVTIAGQGQAADGAKRIVEDIIQGLDPFGPGGPGSAGGAGGPGVFPGGGFGAPTGFPGAAYGGGFPGYGGPPAYGFGPQFGAPGFVGYGGPQGGAYGGMPGGLPGGMPGGMPGGYGGGAPGGIYGGGYGGGAEAYGAPGGGYGGPGGFGGGAPGASAPGVAPPGGASQWQELHDDQGRPYYYNAVSGVTQWERPADL